jgi:prevent-host-death family protein
MVALGALRVEDGFDQPLITNNPMRIAMHLLKPGLSHCVAQARAGEVIEVTSHGKLAVRIVGIPSADNSGIGRLLARGAAQWGGGKPALHAAVELEGGGTTVSEMVREGRD